MISNEDEFWKQVHRNEEAFYDRKRRDEERMAEGINRLAESSSDGLVSIVGHVGSWWRRIFRGKTDPRNQRESL